jgi:hypothetical protein
MDINQLTPRNIIAGLMDGTIRNHQDKPILRLQSGLIYSYHGPVPEIPDLCGMCDLVLGRSPRASSTMSYPTQHEMELAIEILTEMGFRQIELSEPYSVLHFGCRRLTFPAVAQARLLS